MGPRRDDGTKTRDTGAGSRRHRVLLIGAGALGVILAGMGGFTALAGRASSAAQPRNRSVLRPAPATDPAAQPKERSVVRPRPAKTDPAPTTEASPPEDQASATPTSSDPTALADGTYPTYVRGVDVRGATITVDVIQTFTGKSAVRAAIENGTPRDEARQFFYPVYVRNQNDLLRTLPVAPDVSIQFIGECESPGTRDAQLSELSERTTPFETTFFYSITVSKGQVQGVVQHLALPAC
jgi:hypothetical protein